MNNSQFLVYINRFNEVKPYEIKIVREYNEWVYIYDLIKRGVKIFNKSRIFSYHSSFEKATAEALSRQTEYKVIPRNKTNRSSVNPEKKFEVCFTGFTKAEKAELTQRAEANSMFVRKSVSVNLGLLICGENRGRSKLEKAEKMGVPTVSGIDGFNNFLETGEVEFQD